MLAPVLGAAIPALAHAEAPVSPGEVTAVPDPQSIVGGTPTEAGEFDGVVAIQAGGGLCTGTVVAPRLILTAAHCLADLAANERVIVHFGPTIDDGQVDAEAWGTHPQFCRECKEDIFDYGYVTLGSDFTLPDGYTLPVVDQAEWDRAMTPGEEVILVGYGDDRVTSFQGGIGVKREVATTVVRISKGGLEFYAGGHQMDSCAGDSGGPAFVRSATGQLRLAGITSRGSSPCGDGGYYGAPYPALCWVRSETGVDLLGAECSNCDCIDTSPPGDDDNCALDRRGAAEASPLWLVALAGIGVHRRIRRRRR
ncbi:MAG: S1 family peptidase [Myxococcales bacterium]|nr:S1 family peptidase [Myxococcales bacterium]